MGQFSTGVDTIARGTVPLALFGPQGYAILMGRLSRPTLLATAASGDTVVLAVLRLRSRTCRFRSLGLRMLNRSLRMLDRSLMNGRRFRTVRRSHWVLLRHRMSGRRCSRTHLGAPQGGRKHRSPLLIRNDAD